MSSRVTATSSSCSARARQTSPVGHPHADNLISLPGSPFAGELGYFDLINLLRRQARWLTRAERRVVEDLNGYLEFKRSGKGVTASIRRSVQATGRTSQPSTS
jgi:hypothetical protein